MNITVDVKGFEAVKAHLNGQGKQVAFAASRALNAIGKAVADAMPEEIEKVINKPTPFTKRGVRVLKYANKNNLGVVVGFMAAQAAYMKWQTDGGTRSPGPGGLKLPAAIKVNEFGNIPRGIIARLVAVARKERKLGKVTSRRTSVSNKVDLFYGDPKDQAGKSRPRGIYKIVGQSLIPLIIFPVTPARYRKRLDFPAVAEKIVRQQWSSLFDAAMAEAIRTTK